MKNVTPCKYSPPNQFIWYRPATATGSKRSAAALADVIPWSEFEQAFAKHYTPGVDCPAKPIRLMVGLQLLKYIENLSDEKVVVQFKRNPYYQAFSGLTEFSLGLPCDSTELVHFRKRIGEEGFEKIFQVSVGLHGKAALEATVNIDTTVQEKNITYPTDAKLAIKIINRLNKLAKAYGIQQRRTFTQEVKNLRLAICNGQVLLERF